LKQVNNFLLPARHVSLSLKILLSHITRIREHSKSKKTRHVSPAISYLNAGTISFANANNIR
jgi:hypothetical protein